MSESQGSPTGAFREFSFVASAGSVGNMRKEAHVDVQNNQGQIMMTYDLASDEHQLLGGDDSAPPPLAFFTSSIAFCLMTQISRYAHMRKLDVESVKMTTIVKYRNEGSVLAGNIQGYVDEITSVVEIKSTESTDTIQKLLSDAENGCYVHYALTNPLEVSNKLVHHQ